MFIIFFAIATLEIMCGVIAGHTRLVKFSQMYQMIDWWWLKVNKCIKYSVTATTLQPPIKQLCRIIVAYINFGLHVWYFCNPGMSIGMKVFNATYLYHSLSLNTPYGIKEQKQKQNKQGKSEGFESCDRPIVRKRPIWVKIGDVLYRVTLKFDGWPWKTIGHLSFAVSSFVQHFIAIGEFKLELQSGNAPIWVKFNNF